MARNTHTSTEPPEQQYKTQPKKTYTLNQKQTHILKILFKFRFITAPLLAPILHKTDWTVIRALHILIERGIVARHYNSNYKLNGIAARYYLTKEGLAVLKTIHPVDSQTLHPYYKNNVVSRAYIDHHITTLEIFLHLKACYLDTFKIYTRYELARLDTFPTVKPDMFLEVREEVTEYFLELHDGVQSFVARKRFDTLLKFFYEQGWGGYEYPILLFVLPSKYTEDKLQKHVARKLYNAGMRDELTVLTTTIGAITKNDSNPKIWSDVLKPKQLRSLQ